MSTPNTKSYIIWNNNGGVGKSTITFHIASTYANSHPEEDIVVIDMCPQANVSMMLLGGSIKGEGIVQELISLEEPKSVVGYITDSLIGSIKDHSEYLINVSKKNQNISDNLYLLSGDGNLELIAPFISERANMLPISANDKPWKKAHSIIRNLTDKKINEGRKTVYFIDTNPSFSVYTQMAILAGDNLLIPINADDSSIFAIVGLFNLIYGSDAPHPVYGKYTFVHKVKENEMLRPKIHLLLGNRLTQKIGAAKAFKALSEAANKKMYEEFKKDIKGEKFVDKNILILNERIFCDEFAFELRDFNSAGVVASNLGIPLEKMVNLKYEVYGDSIQVAKDQSKACTETIKKLVNKL